MSPRSALASINGVLHVNPALFAVALAVLTWFSAAMGVRWAGSPATLSARIDTVAAQKKVTDAATEAHLTLIDRKVDILIVLQCQRMTTGQKQLASGTVVCP